MDVVDKEDMCCYCKISSASLTGNSFSCKIIAFQFGGNLVGKEFCIKVSATNDVEDFLNNDDTSCYL